MSKKMTFALAFCNRGFMPGELIYGARDDMKRFNLGCIGARTTAFKTTRFDEIAMQKHGINVESFDLSELFFKVQNMSDDDPKVLAKKEHLMNYTDFSLVPEKNKNTLAKVSVAIDGYIEEYHPDALALRCWNEMEQVLRISFSPGTRSKSAFISAAVQKGLAA